MRSLLFGLILCLLATGCTSQAQTRSEPIANTTPNPAAVLPPGAPRVIAPGTAGPWEGEVDLAAKAPGLIKEVLVKEGDVVQAGQVLVRFENTTELARVEAQKARIKAAEASKTRTSRGFLPEERGEAQASAEAALARAKASKEAYERELALFEKGASTQEAVDRAKRQAEADEAQARAAAERAGLLAKGARIEDVSLASATLEASYAELKEAEANLADREIKAPRAGTILRVNFEVGEYYSPTSGALLILGDMSRTEITLEVDELEVSRIAKGQRVIITTNSNTEPLGEGKIFDIAPRMGKKSINTERPDQKEDTRILEVKVEFAAGKLLSGQRVWGTIAVEKQ